MKAVENLYVHFPFCRSKCTYCSLYSRVGVSADDRDRYVHARAKELRVRVNEMSALLKTVYFGGGSPALCDLGPILEALRPRLTDATEFTVELHPLDVTESRLATLRTGGVNRISLGVQSLDDAVLAAMGRGYTALEAARAFATVKRFFSNAGIDLIVGYPGDACSRFDSLRTWGLCHCSVYSLQNERQLAEVPDDAWTLDRVRETASLLASFGLHRYEISNYARAGAECRHNLAVWRGEDYLGLGEGACGRVGRLRTRGCRGASAEVSRVVYETETLSPERDEVERRIFALRTREGLNACGRDDWRSVLDSFCSEGLLTCANDVYRLTSRGTEVCDSILAELV